MKFETTITALQVSETDEDTVERLMDQYDTSELPEDPALVDGASGELAQFLELTRQQTKQEVSRIFDGEPEVFEISVEVVEDE